MDKKRITILIKEPWSSWHAAEVEDDLETYQKIVGGYIEGIGKTITDVFLFCNEEGKLLQLEPNFIYHGDLIVGTVFAVRSDSEGNFVSVTQEDIEMFMELQ